MILPISLIKLHWHVIETIGTLSLSSHIWPLSLFTCNHT